MSWQNSKRKHKNEEKEELDKKTSISARLCFINYKTFMNNVDDKNCETSLRMRLLMETFKYAVCMYVQVLWLFEM